MKIPPYFNPDRQSLFAISCKVEIIRPSGFVIRSSGFVIPTHNFN